MVCLFQAQAIERGSTQVSPAPDEQGGPSGAAEQSISESDNTEVRGSRFSKSAEERQKMLKQRKEEMLQQARRFVHCSNISTTKVVRLHKKFDSGCLFFFCCYF